LHLLKTHMVVGAPRSYLTPRALILIAVRNPWPSSFLQQMPEHSDGASAEGPDARNAGSKDSILLELKRSFVEAGQRVL
jgi:hypothetical protein